MSSVEVASTDALAGRGRLIYHLGHRLFRLPQSTISSFVQGAYR